MGLDKRPCQRHIWPSVLNITTHAGCQSPQSGEVPSHSCSAPRAIGNDAAITHSVTQSRTQCQHKAGQTHIICLCRHKPEENLFLPFLTSPTHKTQQENLNPIKIWILLLLFSIKE